MSDNRDDLTKASGITADVVSELGAYYSAKDMRVLQTGLTTAASELRALTQRNQLIGRLGEKLSHEQRELLNNAAALLDSIRYNVEHAKERKVRIEKALERKRKQWEREAEQLVKTLYTLPVNTVSEQMQILDIYLVASVELGRAYYMKNLLELRRVIQEDPPRWSNHTVAHLRRLEVSSLLADLRTATRDYLCSNLEVSPANGLEKLQLSLDARRTEVLAQPEVVATRHIWNEALKDAAFITSVMPSGGPTK